MSESSGAAGNIQPGAAAAQVIGVAQRPLCEAVVDSGRIFSFRRSAQRLSNGLVAN